ncbi:MAG: NUDIX domain-containing protein [Oscillospiraceae bacterium]|nr:NUDIX domain-containing protein [Oscillospiraceae bacterium]
MGSDLTLPVDGGFVNLRVGAIIRKDERVLMVGNDSMPYYYSVGGRIHFGETAEEAVVREVEEETGVRMEIDRLGFVEEDFFYADVPGKEGRLIQEISFYFYMKTPPDFEPVCRSFTEFGASERLEWVSPDTEKPFFPRFFRTELADPKPYVRHIVTDDRNLS